jgi:hypothetical protein
MSPCCSACAVWPSAPCCTPSQLAKPCGLLLANAKLLARELTDAHAEVLQLLTLLAVNASSGLRHLATCLCLLHQQVGDVLTDRSFLPGQRALLRCNIAKLLPRL